MSIDGVQALRELIHSLAEHEPDPARVTHKILMSITGEEARVIVSVTLIRFVREVMTEPHRSNGSPGGFAESPGGTSREYATRDGRKTPSSSTAAIRDWISLRLNAPAQISPDNGREWKFFGDCSRDDCLALATNRHRKAAELVARAEEYERIAEAIEQHEVETVRELPREVLEGLLRR